MIYRKDADAVRAEAHAILSRSGIHVLQPELDAMETADFGLGDIRRYGAQIISLVDTDQIAVKLIILLPKQVLPEHKHPPLGDYPGKQETVRCEWGEFYLYLPGESPGNTTVLPSPAETFTSRNEHLLYPGQQVTLPSNTLHWFRAGDTGAIAWSFSTKAVDAQDIFTNPNVRRKTIIEDEG